MNAISDALNGLFTNDRIVVWYDADRLYEQDWNELHISDVQKHTVQNNEFALKYKLLIESPKEKHLVYAPFARPQDEENWLLDIELSHRIFHSDPASMILEELTLPIEKHRTWVGTHLSFFKNKKRKSQLSALVGKNDSKQTILRKMIQVVLQGERDDLEYLIMLAAASYRSGNWDAVVKQLEGFGLERSFFQEWNENFSYSSSAQSIKDFILKAFIQSLPRMNDANTVLPLNEQAVLWLAQWKDSRAFAEDYRWYSQMISDELDLKERLAHLDVSQLLETDLIEAGEQLIIRKLIEKVLVQGIRADKIRSIISDRRNSFWFDQYKKYYECILLASELIEASEKEIRMEDLEAGITWYVQTGFKADQAYRRFIQAYRETSQDKVLHDLNSYVDKLYTNGWLDKMTRSWQEVLDRHGAWYQGTMEQRHFFDGELSQALAKGGKVFVVISDALRFECGQQLHADLLKEKRFHSDLNYRVTSVPSYTQLGMAALLPHTELEIREGDKVYVDGMSSMGTENRTKILNSNSGVRSIAVLADDIMRWKSRGPDAKDLVQNHDLIYVYHNGIDKTGDDKVSEERLTEAVELELKYLKDLLRKLANMNANNLLVTADHGFLYQNESVEATDYTMDAPEGDECIFSRRYAISQNLGANDSLTIYSSKSLGLKAGCEIGIPRGLMRFRKKGSGSRYVHGGSTLQEAVIPVLKIEKKRSDTIQKVQVDLLSKASNKITTHSKAVRLYQLQAVDDYWQERTLRIYFANKDVAVERRCISDIWTQVFNSSSDRAGDREYDHGFRFSTDLKRGDVHLVLEEAIDGTEEWKEVGSYPFILALTMDNDFDQ